MPRPPCLRPLRAELPCSLAMNIQSDAVFNTVLHNTREAITYMTDFVHFKPETVHLQLEEIRQEIQDSTSDYLINIPKPNKIFLRTADETINYIT